MLHRSTRLSYMCEINQLCDEQVNITTSVGQRSGATMKRTGPSSLFTKVMPRRVLWLIVTAGLAARWMLAACGGK
jgi:hypothetical protein